MATPTDAPVFGSEVWLCGPFAKPRRLSEALADLLVVARESYAWPTTEKPAISQQRIIDLETETHRRIVQLDSANAHWIVQAVSRWGGNNASAQSVIANAPPARRSELAGLVGQLLNPDSVRGALEGLAKQPGIGLVMATKIYRFCDPHVGAALDRHSSYFFNSLQIRDDDGGTRPCTRFKREWANGKHRTSRLASYSMAGCFLNLNEYLATYLPLLRTVATLLNAQRGGFVCAASRTTKSWYAADVEMAAYYWWSRSARYR
jgi:hypothetical protein